MYFPFKDKEEKTRLTQRHEELMAAIEKGRHGVDGRGRIVGSELAMDFAPMPLWNLAAMLMVSGKECTDKQGWDLADTKDREVAYESRGRERALARARAYFQHVLFTHAPQVDPRDLLKWHSSAIVKSMLLAACVRPFDWKVVAGIHRKDGLVGYRIECLTTGKSATVLDNSRNPHVDDIRDQLIHYSHPELTAQVEAFKLIQMLQPLRTVRAIPPLTSSH